MTRRGRALLVVASAFLGRGLAQTCFPLSIDGSRELSSTAPYYATFNIDSSRDRDFFS